MQHLTRQLADALRRACDDLDQFSDDGAREYREALAALEAHQAGTESAPAKSSLDFAEPLERFVTNEALRDYAEAQYRASQVARAPDWPHGPENGEMYAGGCDQRRRVALDLAERLQP